MKKDPAKPQNKPSTAFWRSFEAICLLEKVSPTRACKDMNLSNSIATTWRNGVIPGPNTLRQIAAYFKAPVEYFMEDTLPTSIYNVKPPATPIPSTDNVVLADFADVVRSQQATISAQQSTIDRLSRLLEDKEQELRELRTEIKLEKRDTIPRVASAS